MGTDIKSIELDLIYIDQLTDPRSVSENNNCIITRMKGFTMSSRRSTFKIAVDVLKVICEGDQKPTRIMYACNLSWNSLKNTLELLVTKGYLDEEFHQKKKLYSITNEGRDVLGYYSGLENLVQVTTN